MSIITPEARERCAETLDAQHRMLQLEMAFIRRRINRIEVALGIASLDMAEVDAAFEADLSWSAQAAKQNKGWQPGGIEP